MRRAAILEQGSQRPDPTIERREGQLRGFELSVHEERVGEPVGLALNPFGEQVDEGRRQAVGFRTARRLAGELSRRHGLFGLDGDGGGARRPSGEHIGRIGSCQCGLAARSQNEPFGSCAGGHR